MKRKKYFFQMLFLFIFSLLCVVPVFAWDHPMKQIHMPVIPPIHIDQPQQSISNTNNNNTVNTNVNNNTNQNSQSQSNHQNVNSTVNIDNENNPNFNNSIQVNAVPTPAFVVAAVQPVTIEPSVQVSRLPETGAPFGATMMLLGLLPLGIFIRKSSSLV